MRGPDAGQSGAMAMALLVAAFLWAGQTRAQDEPDCENPMDQFSMTYCAGQEYMEADAILNELWPQVIAVARDNDEYVADIARDRGVPTTVEALREAQRAWIKFRDAQCSYEAYEVFGGTMQPMVGSLCLARLTEERNAFFRSVLESRP
ncbi:MAG: lysozyme inhibitor LprI family protein [Hoeflea sp.]|uniref:lysozyme inhibitor LprI family protein n=1 Tax=Hoeflea sp. TaxID=1940281 RepID=UPI0032EBAAAC